MARNPIERALGVWSGTNYRSVMLPGLGVVTCGELCDAITALKAENERLAQERQDSAREWRTAFDSMQQRAIAAERALAERAGGVKVPIGYALVPVEPTDRMVSAYVAAKPKGAGFNHPRKGDDKKAWFAAHEKKCRERWKAMLSVSALTEPATPSALVDQITDDVWAADKSDENPAVIDRDGPAAPEDREAVTWTGLLEILAESSFVSESRAATLRAIAEHLRFARPAEQAVTEAARSVLEWYERDGSVGGAVEPFEALKAAMEAGR